MRLVALIDGFNIYHSVRDAEKVAGTMREDARIKGLRAPPEALANFRWLNMPGLVRSFQPNMWKGATIERIRYFSAYAFHQPERSRRHHLYIKALKAHGVEENMHHFTQKNVHCNRCGQPDERYEEKQTDVAIGVAMVEAVLNPYVDGVVLVSGDTDQVPAIKAAKRVQPNKPVAVITPYARHNDNLRDTSDKYFKIGLSALAQWQWPQTHVAPNGETIVRPPEYD